VPRAKAPTPRPTPRPHSAAPHPKPHHPKPHHTAPHPRPHPRPHARPHSKPHFKPHAKPHPRPHAKPHPKPQTGLGEEVRIAVLSRRLVCCAAHACRLGFSRNTTSKLSAHEWHAQVCEQVLEKTCNTVTRNGHHEKLCYNHHVTKRVVFRSPWLSASRSDADLKASTQLVWQVYWP